MHTPADGPVSRLRWYPERGFELDLNAVVGDTAIMLVAVPLPADGTVELRAGKLELDKLEILFKAQVDVNGAPGQLTEAFVTLLPSDDGGEVLRLDATVEDVEAEDVNKLSVEVSVDVPGEAPEAGGPRPDPVDEAELDWDDDDTHEAFFKDPLTQEDPLPGAARAGGLDDEDEDEEDDGDAAAAPSAAERGFDRLLKALLAEPPVADDDADIELADDEPPPVDDSAQRVTSGGTVLSLLASADAVSEEVEPGSVADPADARGLLEFLVEREALELEDGHSADDLVAGAAPILASPRSPGARAAELSEWLFSQDAVAELYIGDDDLAALIGQW